MPRNSSLFDTKEKPLWWRSPFGGREIRGSSRNHIPCPRGVVVSDGRAFAHSAPPTRGYRKLATG
jgi:hypothetical protein